MRHRLIGGIILEKTGDFAFNQIGICSDQPDSACVDAFRSFSGITHDEHWFSETWSLFLHTTGIGEQKS